MGPEARVWGQLLREAQSAPGAASAPEMGLRAQAACEGSLSPPVRADLTGKREKDSKGGPLNVFHLVN